MSEISKIVCPKCAAINRVPSSKPALSAKCGKCGSPMFSGVPTELTSATFDKHITKNDIPVVVDFWAEWCGPCKTMAPEFSKATKILEPNVRMAKLNTEQARDIAGKYAIRSIPTLMIFKNGKLTSQQPGALSASQIQQWVAQNS